MKVRFTRVLVSILLCVLCLAKSGHAQQNENAKPWVFWYWVKGAVSKEGITADLEAMKTNGIAGAYLMSIQGPDKTPVYTPPVVQLTPEWWKMVEFAMSEAKRLDLKLGMHVSDGFALAGGPWITPELSMQKVVWSTINIHSTATKIKLPQPETKENFYRDIAVYAYPTPPGIENSTRTIVPKITASNGADASGLVIEGNKKNFGTNENCSILYEFKQPFTCRTITIRVSGNNYQAQRLKIEVSNDGKIFQSVGQLEAPRHGWQDTDEAVTHSIVPTTARFFRFVYDKSGSEPGTEDLDAAKWKPSLKLLNLELGEKPSINQFEGKNGSIWRVSKRTTDEQVAQNLCIPLNKIINLTGKLNADGSLNWTAPKGNWTILRVGHTTTGHTNATGGGGMGLECDKFNPEAVKLQFKNWYGEAIKHAGPEIAKKVLSVFHVDSWECGSQNWSDVFQKEFKKRRGYDLTPYLPIMTGLPVENLSVSEGFLYDVRKTISELVVDQFYKTLAQLAKDEGVTFTAESIAPTMMSDGLLHYKTVDVPMGEFWLNSPTHDKPNDMFDAISGAHIYGKNIIQAEAFTTVRMDWNEHPANMKTLQDRNYASGINKLVYHVFTHNPWLNRKPGMTLDGVGLYFQRDQTWWKAGKAWIDYATRTQNLLQQGKPVTDIAVFTGEELPRRAVLPDRLVATLPGNFGNEVLEAEAKRLSNIGEPLRQIPAGVTHSANMADPENWVNPLRGYAYDSFNPDVFQSATVKNGEVVFESGASYKVLVFPDLQQLNPNQYIGAETIKKLDELIRNGAKVIIGKKPIYSIDLQNSKASNLNDLINNIWEGNFESYKNNNHPLEFKKLGKGIIYKAPFYGSNFTPLQLEPDFFATENSDKFANKLAFAHRKSTEKELYFISNQMDKSRTIDFSFRTAGKIPYVYDAVNDVKTTINSWNSKDGRTDIKLKFEANQSLFVIFEQETTTAAIAKGDNWSTFKSIQNVSDNWQVQFDSAFGGPAASMKFEKLIDWTKHPDSSIKYYSGTAVYSKTFNFKNKTKGKIWLDLGAFSAIAQVKVNGIDCGTLWTAPHRVDISTAIRSGKNNILIEVSNTWANRLIGDQKQPENKRITNTVAPFRLDGKPLNTAGLLGPVTILEQE